MGKSNLHSGYGELDGKDGCIVSLHYGHYLHSHSDEYVNNLSGVFLDFLGTCKNVAFWSSWWAKLPHTFHRPNNQSIHQSTTIIESQNLRLYTVLKSKWKGQLKIPLEGKCGRGSFRIMLNFSYWLFLIFWWSVPYLWSMDIKIFCHHRSQEKQWVLAEHFRAYVGPQGQFCQLFF